MAEREVIRFGILGAARIAPAALIRPARETPAATVRAVAARDRTKAEAFAKEHGVPQVHGSYEDVLADPEIDAIYNPLPNGLHCEWTIRALEAGKHVLCEKPLGSNAAEARRMAEVARATGRLLVEAFHYRDHPLAARMREIVASGTLGKLRHLEATMAAPLPFKSDIRYNWDLAGGATMDMGCYTLDLVRFLAQSERPGEPTVVSAKAKLSSPKVDRAMRAELQFEGGPTATIACSLWSSQVLNLSCRAVGEKGEMRVINPYVPQIWHRLSLTVDGRATRERMDKIATYTCQLQAFTEAILAGRTTSDLTGSIANMEAIDAVYEAAGLPRRGT